MSVRMNEQCEQCEPLQQVVYRGRDSLGDGHPGQQGQGTPHQVHGNEVI